MRFVLRLCGWLALAVAVGGACGGDEGECEGGDCLCGVGEACDFDCEAPPCHVRCEGENSSCAGACANGSCTCGDASSCDFTCAAPPCHVTCGKDASCTGTCANGSCTCDVGSACTFGCGAPPCHVTCAGDNASCAGTCANGSCTCGPGSSCEFTCQSGPCHVTCAEGADCLVRCPNGDAGTQGCDITACDGDDPVVCPDQKTTTCGRPCPP